MAVNDDCSGAFFFHDRCTVACAEHLKSRERIILFKHKNKVYRIDSSNCLQEATAFWEWLWSLLAMVTCVTSSEAIGRSAAASVVSAVSTRRQSFTAEALRHSVRSVSTSGCRWRPPVTKSHWRRETCCHSLTSRRAECSSSPLTRYLIFIYLIWKSHKSTQSGKKVEKYMHHCKHKNWTVKSISSQLSRAWEQ